MGLFIIFLISTLMKCADSSNLVVSFISFWIMDWYWL